jgi:predicted MFS family arabinose efflux permease
LWFDRKRGLALGLASGSQALGGVILPLLITTLVARAGWQSAVLALAAIQLLVCLPLVWMLVGDSPAPYGWLPDGDEARGQPKTLQVAGFTAIAVLRQPEFWRLAACFAVLGMCMYAVLINIVLILGKTASMTPAEVARFQAIAGVAVLIGRVGFGYLLDRWSARMVAILAVVCGAAGVAMYAHPASPALLLVGTLLIGASVGGESDLLPYLASRYFGTRSLSTVFGLFLSVFFIGAALGPTLFALVAGSDNVVPALHMLIGLYAIPILLFLTMGAPRLPRSDQWHAGLAGKE